VRKAALLALSVSCLVCAQDATDIIRHSVERDATNFERFKNYTFLERAEERRYGRSGNLSSKEIQTYEFMVLGGRPYGKLVERETEADSAQASEDWERVTKQYGAHSFSAKPAVNLRPTVNGLEVVVRYITRAPQRNAMKSKLFQVIVDLLHKPSGTGTTTV